MSPSAARPAHSLTESDLRTYSVWRFVIPEEYDDPEVDESYVVPDAQSPSAGHSGSYLVAAQYELENGTRLPGMVQVDVIDTQIEFTPVTIFVSGKTVDPLGRDTEPRLRRILKAEHVQPVRWYLDALLQGESEHRTEPISKPGLLQELGLLAQLARLKLMR
jgi:hypothetical protein